MLPEPTLDKLKTMKLIGMSTAWTEQNTSPQTTTLAFDDRFGLIVDAEWTHRDNKKVERNLREAKMRMAQACVEGIDFPAKREVDKAIVCQLATCRWVREHQSVIVTGATGTGKTYIACALANHACRRGFRVVYKRASRLYDEFKLARADGSYARLLARLARYDVLVIDDFAMAPITSHERQDLLEVLEDRYALRSTIVTSQIGPNLWHDYLNEPTAADALCDRLVNNAHRLALKGPSRRKEKVTDQEEN